MCHYSNFDLKAAWIFWNFFFKTILHLQKECGIAGPNTILLEQIDPENTIFMLMG